MRRGLRGLGRLRRLRRLGLLGQLRQLGRLRLLGQLGRLRPLGPLGLLGLRLLGGALLLTLGACTGSTEEEMMVEVPETEEPGVKSTAICFKGEQGGDEAVTRGEWRGDEAVTRGEWRGDEAVTRGEWRGDEAVTRGEWRGDEAVTRGEWRGDEAVTRGEWRGDEAVTRGEWRGDEAVTRSETPLSDSGVTSFTVWGYKNAEYYSETNEYDKEQLVFPAYSVGWTRGSEGTTTTNSDGWDYFTPDYPDQTIKYWDWNAKAYRFFAATNWGGTTPASTDDYETNVIYGKEGTYEDGRPNPSGVFGAYKSFELTMAVDVTSRDAIEAMPYFSSLWFSNGNADDYPTCQFGAPVKLVFMKPCSKVRFKYNYVYDRNNILMESQEFKPTIDFDDPSTTIGIARKGTFTVNYPLTGTATKEWYTIDKSDSGKLEAFYEDYDPDDPTKEYIDSSNGWYYVFPNPKPVSYTLSITINGSEKRCTVPAEYMRWLPGYSYTYIFKINEEGGVEIDLVQSASSEWTELVGDKTVYNW